MSGFEEAGRLYEQAYVDQLARFYRSCADSLAGGPPRAEDVAELGTYSSAFATMEAACKMAVTTHAAPGNARL